jgi:hypothetical protein
MGLRARQMQCREREERWEGGPEAPGHGSKANYGGVPAPTGRVDMLTP